MYEGTCVHYIKCYTETRVYYMINSAEAGVYNMIDAIWGMPSVLCNVLLASGMHCKIYYTGARSALNNIL